MEIVPGPDFPTGGIILGRTGIYNAYGTGRGSILMRGKVDIEARGNDREAIVITEVPYQVNKATMIEKMAELVREKRIEGISDIRDESDRQGYRVVVELKRDANAEVVLNQLYRFTPLQTSFGANMVALNGGKPEVLTLADMLKAFVAFREDVVSRRTKFLLRKARERAHVLVGLAIAVANIDEVIRLIRARARPAGGARAVDGPALAGRRRRVAHPAHRRSAPQDQRGRHLLPFGGAGAGHSRSASAAAYRTWPRRDFRRTQRHRCRDRRFPGYSRLARAHSEDRQGRACGGPRRVRHAPPDGDRRRRRRHGGRGSHPARGYGRHRHPQGLHQARAAFDLQGAGPRRQRPLRHVDQGRGRRHPAVRRQHAHARAVLLVARHRLQGEGLAPAHRHAAVGRQVSPQPAALAGRRAHHLDPASAGERGQLGRARRHVRHHARHGAPQQAVGFRPGEPRRQDRHEARGGGRRDPQRRDLYRGSTMSF